MSDGIKFRACWGGINWSTKVHFHLKELLSQPRTLNKALMSEPTKGSSRSEANERSHKIPTDFYRLKNYFFCQA